MALTPQDTQDLNAASARIAAGRGSRQDTANVAFARRKYGYRPTTATTVTPADTSRSGLESSGYQYLGTNRTVQDAIKQYGSSRVKDIAGTGYFIVPKDLKNPSPGDQIPVDKLPTGNQKLNTILGGSYDTSTIPSDIAGLIALQGQTTDAQKSYDALTGQLTDLQKQLGSQGADLQTEQTNQGVPEAYRHLQELNLTAAQLQGDLTKFDAETQNQVAGAENQLAPTSIISANQNKIERDRALIRSSKASELSATVALAQAYQGNAELGMNLAQKAVEMKYAPILANIDTLKTQLGFASEKMSKEDKNRASIISELLTYKKDQLDKEKKIATAVSDLAVKAATLGAPLNIVNAMRTAKTEAEAASIGAQYLGGIHTDIVTLATDAAKNGAPIDVVRRMKMSKDTTEAAQIGSKYLKGNLEKVGGLGGGVKSTIGFSTSKIESDVRQDAVSLLDLVDAGTMTKDRAYTKLRKLYSVSEVTDDALRNLLDIVPPTKQTTQTTSSKSLSFGQRFSSGGLRGVLGATRSSSQRAQQAVQNTIDKIGNWLFK